MEDNELNLENEKKSNLIIITKPGINSTKNNHSYLTLKEGEYSLKIDFDNSINSKLNQQKIFQTISDMRRHIEDKRNKKNSLKTRLIKHNRNNKKTVNIVNDLVTKKEFNNYDTHIKNKKFTSIVIADEDKLSEKKKNLILKKQKI